MAAHTGKAVVLIGEADGWLHSPAQPVIPIGVACFLPHHESPLCYTSPLTNPLKIF
jgi:hypothetical protein